MSTRAEDAVTVLSILKGRYPEGALIVGLDGTYETPEAHGEWIADGPLHGPGIIYVSEEEK